MNILQLKPICFLLILVFILSEEDVEAQAPVSNCVNKTLSVVAHIIKDHENQYGITEQEVQDAIDIANNDFAPMCLVFEICKFNYIDNFQYDTLDYLVKNDAGWSEEDEMVIKYNVPSIKDSNPNKINVYFVTSLEQPDGDGCGNADSSRNLIMVQKSCLDDGKIISHNLGHILGLPNTDGSYPRGSGPDLNGLVDGTNCATTGDKICDTPVDLSDGLVNIECEYTSSVTKDANGQYYIPNVGNIMSKYLPNCKCGFTEQQFENMAESVMTSKRNLW